MSNDWMLGSVYLVMAMMLVVGALIARREPIAKLAKVAIAWVAIFGAGFVLFSFRDDLGFVAQRLKSEATGDPVVDEGQIRIPMAIDGHFWVEGRVNGHPVKFLVDSGATITTIDRAAARAAGLQISPYGNEVVRTGNGLIEVARGRAETLSIGPIERENISVHVTESEDINVLGMNYLSSLDRWGVEGRWLVLDP